MISSESLISRNIKKNGGKSHNMTVWEFKA